MLRSPEGWGPSEAHLYAHLPQLFYPMFSQSRRVLLRCGVHLPGWYHEKHGKPLLPAEAHATTTLGRDVKAS